MDCICLTTTRPSWNISHPTQVDVSNNCFQSLSKVIKNTYIVQIRDCFHFKYCISSEMDDSNRELLNMSPQTWPHTHFCSAIMGVKELYVPNSPWTKGPITGGMDSTGSWLQSNDHPPEESGSLMGDRVTPNMATYAFMICHYGGKGVKCTK